MNLEEFATVVRQTLSRLPDWTQEAMHNADIQILDEPDADLDPHNERLLGLYTGVPREKTSFAQTDPVFAIILECTMGNSYDAGICQLRAGP